MENFSIRRAAEDYSFALAGYETAHRLPPGFFLRRHLDHLAIKTQDVTHFDGLANTIIDLLEEAYCLEHEGRFLIAAKLAGTILVGVHGRVSWIEIKEPRPEKIGEDIVGLEHTEFYAKDFDKALHQVKAKGLNHELQTEGEHHRINIALTDAGHEVRITDTPLQDIVIEKFDADEAHILKLAA